MKRSNTMLRLLVVSVAILLTDASIAAAGTGQPSPPSRFIDAEDGWLDHSTFLDTAYGFVPFVAPITEPALGYGALGAAVFIDRHNPGQGLSNTRPDIGAVGARDGKWIARKHGLHVGIDVAKGPDKPIFYVVFGNAWLRP